MKKKVQKKSVWYLFNCLHGAQWSSTTELDQEDRPCNFSGCRTKPHRVYLNCMTSDRETAYNWFKRPVL